MSMEAAATAVAPDADAIVWPTRTWPLSALTEAQWSFWESEGLLILPNAINASVARAAASAIRAYVGADDAAPSSWYQNELDIYEDVDPETGKKPHHGPAGMVQMFHHQSLWDIRQTPYIHQVFADLWGTEQLYVTCDRAHFKPPQDQRYPKWYDPGAVHVGLHWDVDTRRRAWPVPYTMQAVVYLEDTMDDQGPLKVVPGFHRQLAEWSKSQPDDRNAERPEGPAARELMAEAVPIAGPAGTLVIWHSALPHGPGKNVGKAPRVSAYLTMHPVDAAPFVGAGRPADSPLGMNDAGTLAYLEELQDTTSSTDEADKEEGKKEEACQSDDHQPAASGAAGESGDAPGIPRASKEGRPRRQSRERRVARWRERLPLLDEDPTEEELMRRPPGESDGAPAKLTPLGERLVGLVEWDYDSKRPSTF